jgi:hypothetical protein
MCGHAPQNISPTRGSVASELEATKTAIEVLKVKKQSSRVKKLLCRDQRAREKKQPLGARFVLFPSK